MVGMADALSLAEQSGLDLAQTRAMILGGTGASGAMENLAPKALEGDWKPGFMVQHFLKDIGLALQLAEEKEIALPGADTAFTLYDMLDAIGGGSLGTQAITLLYQERPRPSPPVSIGRSTSMGTSTRTAAATVTATTTSAPAATITVTITSARAATITATSAPAATTARSSGAWRSSFSAVLFAFCVYIGFLVGNTLGGRVVSTKDYWKLNALAVLVAVLLAFIVAQLPLLYWW